MIATGVGHRFHDLSGDPGAMADHDTHDDAASREEHAARLEALARPRSVANPRRTRR